MFGGLGKLAQLLANPQAVKQQADGMRSRLAELRVEGVSAEGHVRVIVSGDYRVISVTITEELRELQREHIEQHILLACANALIQARSATTQELASLTSQLGLPGFDSFLQS